MPKYQLILDGSMLLFHSYGWYNMESPPLKYIKISIVSYNLNNIRCSVYSPVSCLSQLILTDPSKCFWLIDFESGFDPGFGILAGVFGASGAWSGTGSGTNVSGSPMTTEVGRDFRCPCSVCLITLFTRFQFSMTSVALLMTPKSIYFWNWAQTWVFTVRLGHR